FYFFFFQAEDGIRDRNVTGVQTCALPIYIYSAAMWSAAGIRVSEQERFHEKEPEGVRTLYRRHARGNSLYRNQGNGKFQNVSNETGVEMGRWAWCSYAWDFDQDGYLDLYIANGYVSSAENSARDKNDLASF